MQRYDSLQGCRTVSTGLPRFDVNWPCRAVIRTSKILELMKLLRAPHYWSTRDTHWKHQCLSNHRVDSSRSCNHPNTWS